MAKIVCPRCETKNKATRSECKNCGAPLHEKTQQYLPEHLQTDTGGFLNALADIVIMDAPKHKAKKALRWQGVEDDPHGAIFATVLSSMVRDFEPFELMHVHNGATGSANTEGWAKDKYIEECVLHFKIAFGIDSEDTMIPNLSVVKSWDELLKSAQKRNKKNKLGSNGATEAAETTETPAPTKKPVKSRVFASDQTFEVGTVDVTRNGPRKKIQAFVDAEGSPTYQLLAEAHGKGEIACANLTQMLKNMIDANQLSAS